MNTTTNTYNKDSVIQLGDCTFDPDSFRLWRDGTLVSPELTSTEAKLLIHLYENREELFEMSSRIRNDFISKLGPDIMTAKWREMFNQVLYHDGK